MRRLSVVLADLASNIDGYAGLFYKSSDDSQDRLRDLPRDIAVCNLGVFLEGCGWALERLVAKPVYRFEKAFLHAGEKPVWTYSRRQP